jgi:predicted Zn-dependent protease
MNRARNLIALACLTALACAVNPATGKRELSLIGEQQEIAIGRENDQQITAQLGLYEDADLAAYVNRVGQTLAAKSERPGLPWKFQVVDDPVVNAFALPGGFIYVTRGILGHFNSEAELAAVLGHEIGHVTARHSVSQMSKAQLAQLGLGLGSILAPEQAARFGNLAAQGLELMFLKYGRDDERQADDLGLRYALSSGYDPRPMIEVFEMLERVSASAGGGRVPAWLSTHPDPGARGERIASEIATASAGKVERDAYLARIDGVTFGEDPRQGYFRENVFYHPDMQFRLEFPAGWKTQNTRQAVVALAPSDDAAMQLSLSRQGTPQEALRAFLAQEGVTPTSSFGGGNGAGSRFQLAGTSPVEGTVLFFEHGGRVLGVVGYATSAAWGQARPVVERAIGSFDRLTDRRALEVSPARITLALISGLDANARVESGRSYKVVIGGVGS